MAHFIGKTQGQTQETTRLGNERSGIRTVANGWQSGVTVIGDSKPMEYYPNGMDNGKGKVDVFTIVANSGTNGYQAEHLIGRYYRTKDYQIALVGGDSLGDMLSEGFHGNPDMERCHCEHCIDTNGGKYDPANHPNG